MYDVKSMKAEEFIADEEVLATLAYADAHKDDLELVRQTGCGYHVCHISTKESVALIRRAKAEGLDVTCETAPHYLLMDETMLQEDGRFKMNPPLRSPADREALLAELAKNDIYGGVHYRDNTEFSMYTYAQGTCPHAHEVTQHIITMPLHLYLTDEDVQKIIRIVNDFVK